MPASQSSVAAASPPSLGLRRCQASVPAFPVNMIYLRPANLCGGEPQSKTPAPMAARLTLPAHPQLHERRLAVTPVAFRPRRSGGSPDLEMVSQPLVIQPGMLQDRGLQVVE